MSGTATLEVLSGGVYASIQDMGRHGLRRVGVPWAGALDKRLMRIANALVGNDEKSPVIECFDGGQQFIALGGAVRLAVAGDAALELVHEGKPNAQASWRSFILPEGDVLRLRDIKGGRIAAIALEGITLPLALGSASTYARAGLGGLDGRALTRCARLLAANALVRSEQMLASPPARDMSPIRVVAGPQSDYFSDAVVSGFVETEYRVTGQADRMGIRLEGPKIVHLGASDIVSDATVPGSIQVPGNGQPIVLLADAQTAGGYPKIATVISADLPRLAALRPGQTLRFTLVSAQEGERLARTAEAETKNLLASLRPIPAQDVDAAALYTCNLVTGFVDAQSPEYRLMTKPTPLSIRS